MAGRKSKTATAAKPKAGGAVKTAAKSSAKAKVARTSKTKALDKAPARAVDQVLAAAKGVQKSTKKSVTGKSASKSTREPTDKKSLGKIAEVHAELEHLAAYIDAAKREIADIRPNDVKEEFLPSATDELDAIVDATADATNAIMDSCEIVEGVMGEVDAGISTKLMDATTRIYEACTFQDITGQRIGKVVGALKSIEERIDALMDTLGDDAGPTRKKTPSKKKSTKGRAKNPSNTKVGNAPKSKQEITDADLLEGPQLGDKAKNQAEIDALLASFD